MADSVCVAVNLPHVLELGAVSDYNEMVFEVKCVKCGTVYRSELAHVGKSIQCACGSIVKIVPPLNSLTYIAGKSTRSSSPKRSTRKLIPWFAVAGVVVAFVALVSISRFTSAKGRSSQRDNPQVVGERPAQREPTVEAPDVRPITYHTLATGTRLEQDIGTVGHGKLNVENGTDEGAVVRLYDSGDQPVRSFFVQLTAKDMPVGFLKAHTDWRS
jgi:hypothetical protein